jgi:hypothetical protein
MRTAVSVIAYAGTYRRAVNCRFAGASNSANTSARGKIYQPTDGSNDPFIDHQAQHWQSPLPQVIV